MAGCGRLYEQLKLQSEAEAARKEEEDRLIDLLRAEEEAERLRLKAEAQRLHQEQVKLDLQRANEEQQRIRVWLSGSSCCIICSVIWNT